jgi:hypothetical protein
MNFDLDALIDDAVIYGELQDGTSAAWLAQRFDPRRVAVMAKLALAQNVGKEREWTQEEEEFLIRHYMGMSDHDLAQALGRTADGVHIHWERKLRLPARSRNPEWPNLHEVARLLGAPCSKVFRKLIKRGILPGRKLPLGADVWVIHRRDLLRFVCNPRNWIYFKTRAGAGCSVAALDRIAPSDVGRCLVVSGGSGSLSRGKRFRGQQVYSSGEAAGRALGKLAYPAERCGSLSVPGRQWHTLPAVDRRR